VLLFDTDTSKVIDAVSVVVCLYVCECD